MADETSAQMEKMNVDEKKEETAAAMGGREGVAPPIDTGCVAHHPPNLPPSWRLGGRTARFGDPPPLSFPPG